MKQIIGNALGLVGLCIAVAMGLYIEIFCLQVPCILCFLQRACMLFVAFGLYWNLLYGIQIKHYSFSFLAALFGLVCCLRHMGLNVCKTVGDDAVFFCTYRLYTWCFFVFVFSLFCLTLLLFAYTPKQKKVPNWLKYGATGLFTTVILLCAISALYHRGIAF